VRRRHGRRSGGLFYHAALLLFAAALAAPDGAGAFSLGKIRVTGDLNERFKAEIPVRVDGRPGLAARVGDQRDYDRVGVARPEFLDRLSVEVADHPLHPGQKIIYLASSEPVQQPSFNLVVKASLGGGIILENYFLALDFRKDLSLDLPASPEEKAEMERIAAELDALRPRPKEKPRPGVTETAPAAPDTAATLDRFRKEEEEAIRQERLAARPAVAPIPSPREIKEVQKPVPAAKAPEPERKIESVTTAVGAASAGAPATDSARQGVYHVKAGDSLYRIARSLGADGADRDRIVVALWTNNKRHFIRGNLHGLLAGRTLDLSGLDETARSIDRAEASRMIAEQWPLWKGQAVAAAEPVRGGEVKVGAGRPLGKIEVPAVRLPYRNKILAALSGWKESFESGDMTAHMQTYSETYRSADTTKKQLPGVKEKRGFGEGHLDIDLEKTELAERGGVIEVTLAVNENSPGAPRKIYFIEEDGVYRIVREDYRAEEKEKEAPKEMAPGEKGQKPFVVHIASFKSKEAARKMVELLQEKGFNAFEVLSFIPGKGNWYRVVVDRFGSVTEADTFSRAIRKNGLSRYTRILRLPFAIRIGPPMDQGAVAGKMDEYSRMGFSTYSLRAGPGGKSAILLGAFDTRRAAMSAMTLLAGIEEPFTVITP